jgi:hypothetical protein
MTVRKTKGKELNLDLLKKKLKKLIRFTPTSTSR